MRLSPEIADFICAYDVVLLVGTASAAGRPSATAAAVPRIEADGALLTVGLQRSVAPRVLDDLAENPRIAISATRAPSGVSYQVKGRVVAIGPAQPGDQEEMEVESARITEVVWRVNPLARERGSRYYLDLDVRLTIEVESVYVQTPGPGAGARVPT